jgi:hypothetical protein
MISKSLPQLNYINISHTSILDEGLYELCSNIIGLTEINISGGIQLTNRSMVALSHCKGLSTLTLTSSNKITDEGFQILCNSTKKLKNIQIAYYDKITNQAIQYLCLLPNIRTLSLHFIRNITASSFEYISRCKNLTALKFDSTTIPLLNDTLRQVFRGCPNLETLFLAQTPVMGNEEVEELASNCRNLVELILSDCPRLSDPSLFSIAKYCSNLHILILGNRMITDRGIMAIAQNCPKLTTFVLLEAVYSVNNLYTPITDESLLAFAEYCPNFSNLCIPEVAITDRGVSLFYSLIEVNIRGCSHVTAAGIESLINNNMNLHALTILSSQYNTEEIEKWKKIVKIN